MSMSLADHLYVLICKNMEYHALINLYLAVIYTNLKRPKAKPQQQSLNKTMQTVIQGDWLVISLHCSP